MTKILHHRTSVSEMAVCFFFFFKAIKLMFCVLMGNIIHI